MTDTPDLRTLAAEAMRDAFDAMPDDDHRGIPPMQPAFAGTTTPPRPVEVPCSGCCAAADAVLAAVLPAHRRQVLAEAADACSAREDEAGRTYQRDVALDSTPSTRRESAVRQRTWRAAKELLRELASAAPETAPSPRHDDETAPAVPDHTQENP